MASLVAKLYISTLTSPHSFMELAGSTAYFHESYMNIVSLVTLYFCLHLLNAEWFKGKWTIGWKRKKKV